MEHVFRRIRSYNSKVNAYLTIVEEQAMAHAKEADETLAAGRLSGPLHGVPIGIKDVYATAGVRTTWGSKSLEKNVPKEDTPPVARLKRAGAILVGKTNCPEFAQGLQTFNEIAGTTNNPWDRNRTPGGSTGGGAAAIAAGFEFLELGSDTGGSIRTPAHFCGVFGHRSTVNLIPNETFRPLQVGEITPLVDMSSRGPLSRSAQDLRIALEIIGGPAAAESVAYQWRLPAPRGSTLKDYRLGYVLDERFCPLSSDVAEVLSKVIAVLRKAGVELTEGWPRGFDPQGMFENYYFLWGVRGAQRTTKEEQDLLKASLNGPFGYYTKLRLAALTSSYEDWRVRNASRLVARAIWQEYFKTHDAFIMPGNFVAAFPHDHHQPEWERWLDTPAGKRLYDDAFRWNSVSTLTGCPATVAPAGRTRAGLPVGIQILGPYLEDATSIDIGQRIADIVGGFEPPAGFD
jgi:amidase